MLSRAFMTAGALARVSSWVPLPEASSGPGGELVWSALKIPSVVERFEGGVGGDPDSGLGRVAALEGERPRVTGFCVSAASAARPSAGARFTGRNRKGSWVAG